MLAEQVRGGDVDPHGGVVVAGGELAHGAADVVGGDVHQDVDLAEERGGLVAHALDGLGVAEVGADGGGAHPVVAQAFGGVGQLAFPAGDDDDGGPGAADRLGDGVPDAGAAAGDQGRAAGQGEQLLEVAFRAWRVGWGDHGARSYHQVPYSSAAAVRSLRMTSSSCRRVSRSRRSSRRR